ncbi:UPF0149 family protein [Sphingomonas sp. RHCKR47]|uniref:UPF0149 family protein n=1 Tax=Sphingomonas citricola TaxID=2862498 RepID=UPI001CA57371|nr:UPF0149 family protein [Sphingomonas citricola]MBW6524662.1 UPF0149 family protein [Sphingomonas citricola]
MKPSPSRFRRLDGALAALPVEEPLLLTELDGFLTGLLIFPEEIPTDEWMSVIWGAETDGVPPFDDPIDVQWFVDAVTARRREIARDLDHGRLRPIIDVDERNGEALWEYWVDGLSDAISLRPEVWDALARLEPWEAPLGRLALLLAVARGESDLDSMQINAFEENAVVELTAVVQLLYAASVHAGGPTPTPTGSTKTVKVGRNDPCPCGSGRKHKHCCG